MKIIRLIAMREFMENVRTRGFWIGILLIPVIAAVGYEILRWGARHRGNPLVRAIMYPGILVQMITTKQPTDDMVEVAIVSMEEALRADGEELPVGAGTLERAHMDLPGAVVAPEA